MNQRLCTTEPVNQENPDFDGVSANIPRPKSLPISNHPFGVLNHLSGERPDDATDSASVSTCLRKASVSTISYSDFLLRVLFLKEILLYRRLWLVGSCEETFVVSNNPAKCHPKTRNNPSSIHTVASRLPTGYILLHNIIITRAVGYLRGFTDSAVAACDSCSKIISLIFDACHHRRPVSASAA